MRSIGLTGGIASGKSTVVNQLRELGAATIDADILGHQTYEPGTETFSRSSRPSAKTWSPKTARSTAPSSVRRSSVTPMA